MLYIIFAIMAVTFTILYILIRDKKNFLIICLLVIGAFGFGFFSHSQYSQQKISLSRIEAIQVQQKFFNDWFTIYKNNIGCFDQNWQEYYEIISDINNENSENFDPQPFYDRLRKLEQKMILKRIEVFKLNIPQELNIANRNLVEAITQKTRKYVDAQLKTISLSVVTTDPSKNLSVYELRKKLQEIIIRESPEGLFIAQELSELRNNLTD